MGGLIFLGAAPAILGQVVLSVGRPTCGCPAPWRFQFIFLPWAPSPEATVPL